MGCALQELYHRLIKSCAGFKNSNNNNQSISTLLLVLKMVLIIINVEYSFCCLITLLKP